MFWPREVDTGLRRMFELCLQIIQAIPNKATAAQLAIAFPNIFEATDSVVYLDSSATMSPSMIVNSVGGDVVLYACAGMSNYDNVPELFRNWITPVANEQGYAEPYATAARQLIASTPGSADIHATKAIMIGHSYGGAVSAVTSLLSPKVGPNTYNYVYNFGAPKYAKRGYQNLFASRYVRRIFVDNDPVPGLPPPGGDLGVIPAFLANRQILPMLNYCTPSEGLVLLPNLPPQTAANPSATCSPRQAVSLANWLTGDVAFGSSGHTLTQYIQAVNTISDDFPYWIGERIRSAPTPVVVPTPGQLNTVREAAQIGQMSIVTNDMANAARAIQMGVPPRPGVKWTGRKYQGHRALYYGDDFVVALRSRREQIRLVRYLNKRSQIA